MKIKNNVSLSKMNSLRINATAEQFAIVERPEHILQLISSKITQTTPYHILGDGCNILFVSDYLNCLIIKNNLKTKMNIKDCGDHFNIIASSGFEFDDLLQHFLKYQQNNDLRIYGMENLAKIPSQVGSAVVQNIGAYGVEQSDFFSQCKAIDMNTGIERIFTASDCQFKYRSSLFKCIDNQYFITEVCYSIPKGNSANISYPELNRKFTIGKEPTPSDIYSAVAGIRQSKLPDIKKLANAGSFFKNPIISIEQFSKLLLEYPNIPNYQADERIKIPAAFLIDNCGLKGKKIGDVGLFENHSLILVNHGNATGKDVLLFANEIIHTVKNKFGIILEPEVILI
ncbi:MAG: UDP-N-acetylmuramate dehydrogenase [Ignavibacteria bacterium]|jgi:UDP-N-acetylmuramate dehydrogenase|nr:UDP-N-acetylmuramate dehydrogenase [Ignavibacteria bacterium]